MLMQQFIIIKKHDLKRVHLVHAIYNCLLFIICGMKCKYSCQVLCSYLCFPLAFDLYFSLLLCEVNLQQLFSLNLSVIFQSTNWDPLCDEWSRLDNERRCLDNFHCPVQRKEKVSVTYHMTLFLSTKAWTIERKWIAFT